MKSSPIRRQQLREGAARACLDLLAQGFHIDHLTMPKIAALMGFSTVYISTRVGLEEARSLAITMGLTEKNPYLLCQLVLQNDRRVRKLDPKILLAAFRSILNI